MHRLLFICSLLYTFPSFAQVNLWVESQWPFKIGIDGYVQNTEAVSELILRKLDTNEHVISIDLYTREDTIKMFRKLRLGESGNHKYVLTQNFKRKHQLRYRGPQSEIPPGIISMKLQKVLPWPKEVPPKTILASTGDMETPREKTPKAIIDTNASFATVLFDIQRTEYEFEKLKKAMAYTKEHELTTNEVRLVLKALEYDLTRIQFIKAVKEKIIDSKKLSELQDCFDYDVSKSQFKKLIK